MSGEQEKDQEITIVRLYPPWKTMDETTRKQKIGYLIYYAVCFVVLVWVFLSECANVI